MFWATRLLDADDDVFVRELFEAQCVALGNPPNLMLIAVKNEIEKRRLFVGVPNAELLNSYFGFKPCLKNNLPKAPTLIGGCHDVFEALFS